MALGKNSSSSRPRSGCLRSSSLSALTDISEFANCTRALSRKRVVVSDYMESLSLESPFRTPTKKRYGARLHSGSSSFEALPQDVLVKVLCCVEHEDLKQLFHVSKTIREATMIAKKWHFAFSTPSSKTASIKPFSNLEADSSKFDMETPYAPKRRGSYRPRISNKKLSEITVALFHSPEEKWPNSNGLFVET